MSYYLIAVSCFDRGLQLFEVESLKSVIWKPLPKVREYWPATQQLKLKIRPVQYKPSVRTNTFSYHQHNQNKRRMFCQKLKKL